jgi:hypothetical protein
MKRLIRTSVAAEAFEAARRLDTLRDYDAIKNPSISLCRIRIEIGGMLGKEPVSTACIFQTVPALLCSEADGTLLDPCDGLFP